MKFYASDDAPIAFTAGTGHRHAIGFFANALTALRALGLAGPAGGEEGQAGEGEGAGFGGGVRRRRRPQVANPNVIEAQVVPIGESGVRALVQREPDAIEGRV